MPYYFHGSDLVFIDNGSLGASVNPNTKKCPNCHRETSIDLDKCEICDYDFKTRKVDKYICPNCKRQISSKLVKCIMCNYDFKKGVIDYTGKNCYETSKSVVKKTCPDCGKKVNSEFVDCVYCGYGFVNSIHSTSNSSHNLELEYIECPNCNKHQKYLNKFCEICGCDLDQLDLKNDNKILLDNLAYSGFIISEEKYDLFLNNRYFNSPSFCDNLEMFYEKSIFHIKSKFKKGNVLFLSLHNERLKKITELLNDEGYSQYINNNVLFKKSSSLKLLNMLLINLNQIHELNRYFIKHFFIKLPDNIDSCKYFLSLIKYNNVKYLSDDDLKEVNEFIKIYWKYWKLISSSNIDLKSSKLFEDYKNQLDQFKECYNKFFNKSKLNVPVMDLISKLNWHIAFTNMINKMKIIKNISNIFDSDDFIYKINELEELLNNLEKTNESLNKQFQINLNQSYDALYENIENNIEVVKNNNEKGIILMNLNDAMILFYNSDFIFDYIIFDDELSINNELKLRLFLFSKNRLSSVKLWYR